jgi:hypothetical protein
MGTNCAKKVVRLAKGSCHVPKKLILWTIKQKASAQDNGYKQKNKTPDFLSDGMHGFFRFAFGI